jgi:hypothetical protein
MTEQTAKVLLRQSRVNIGTLLYKIRREKEHPDNVTKAWLAELSRNLGANVSQQALILRTFPSLRREKAEQLRLPL